MAKPRVRLLAVEIAFALGIALVLARAAQIQIVQGKQHTETSRANRTVQVDLAAPRGPIYDRVGRPLALTQEVFEVGVVPNEVRDTVATIELLAGQLGIPQRAVRREFAKRWAFFRGPYSAVAVRPLRRQTGVYLDSRLERFYPNGDLARTVIGHPEADGRVASGIERVYDTLLVGTPGRAVELRDRSGARFESPSRLDAFPTTGHQIFLTLDVDLQEIVEDALTTAVRELDALGGDVVVINPSTGEILAMASRGVDAGPTTGGFGSIFEPGSTAKVFALAALLEADLADPAERVYTENGRYETEYRVVVDDHEYDSAWITLREVIRYSSNIGIVKFASRLAPDQQFGMMRAFGLGTRTGVEFPVEAQGILKLPHEWSGTTAAGLALGYEVAVTPLQLAQAYAVIANDGLLVRPTLVREIRDPDGNTMYRHQTEVVRRVMSAEVARTIRDMLEAVVYKGGTGETAALSTYEIAGKTGTAKRAGPGGYIDGSYTATFASVFPADDPQLVMIVKLDDPEGGYARLTAAPVTKEVLERLLATQSSVLDQARLAVAPSPEAGRVEVRENVYTPPVVVPWPSVPTQATDTMRAVPDVVGMSPRRAASELHAAGFRAAVQGLGTVTATTPAAGVFEVRGSLVTILADKRKHP